MIRIEELKLELNYDEDTLRERIRKTLRLDAEEEFSYTLVRKAIDARKREHIHYVLTVDVSVPKERPVLKRVSLPTVHMVTPVRYHFPKSGDVPLPARPVVIGSGPCGLLCAYELALHGYRPIILERGSRVEERQEAVQRFWGTGVLDPNDNAQFGEGGAGTFSDGKLNSSVRDASGRNREVLSLFVSMGADPAILSDAKPHIGTDGLFAVLPRLRARITELGGTFRFRTTVTDFLIEDGRLTGLIVNGNETLPTGVAVLAIGHSARDTFRCLHTHGLTMEAKPFAVGYRIEHPQALIDTALYGFSDHSILPPAPYKLTAQANDRGVYSFCMCPGGYVVNASSEEGRLCVNGMSYRARDNKNSNSAIIVQVSPADFAENGPLAGLQFQETLEEKAFLLGNGKIPQQLYGDYRADRISTGYGAFESATRGARTFANLRGLLPAPLEQSFLSGMELFGQRIEGFARADAILSGIESRTSSPVRICRNDLGESSIAGLYPAGEGAGYAGGIVSAAIDGIRIAEQIAKKYRRD